MGLLFRRLRARTETVFRTKWVCLNSAQNIGTLQATGNASSKAQLSVSCAPTSAVSQGIYTFYIKLTSSNYPDTRIGVYVTVTQSGQGNVQFKLSDIYTGTQDANKQLIQGVGGANITVQNDLASTITQALSTDNLGEALFSNLPCGSYKCRITAN